jgi:phosphoribosylamine-glycine ligase
MAAKGYPGSYKKGTAINGLDKISCAKVSWWWQWPHKSVELGD